ncbi:MAG: phosphatidate cytidylyltransferase [Planctomycetaceae bacterium]|nr:phosphatidate cytidylyltransferase [Planctomycetaceae bacterium]
MRWRLILGPVLAIGLACLMALDAYTGRSAWGLLLLATLLCIRATSELSALFRVRAFEIQSWLVQLGSLIVLCSNWVERLASPAADVHIRQPAALGPCMLAFALVFLVLLWSQAVRFRRPGNSMESLGGEIFIVSYVGILLSMTVQLRWVAGSHIGLVALGSLVVTAKCGDIGAYFLGKFFGRRKLIERLSPGKTWMGACGAVVGAVLGALLWFGAIAPLIHSAAKSANLVWAAVFGIAIGIVGLLGDLCESLIKRDTGKKDSAALLPEFGGVLDLIDSVIYAAPVAYLLWLILPLY